MKYQFPLNFFAVELRSLGVKFSPFCCPGSNYWTNHSVHSRCSIQPFVIVPVFFPGTQAHLLGSPFHERIKKKSKRTSKIDFWIKNGRFFVWWLIVFLNISTQLPRRCSCFLYKYLCNCKGVIASRATKPYTATITPKYPVACYGCLSWSKAKEMKRPPDLPSLPADLFCRVHFLLQTYTRFNDSPYNPQQDTKLEVFLSFSHLLMYRWLALTSTKISFCLYK